VGSNNTRRGGDGRAMARPYFFAAAK